LYCGWHLNAFEGFGQAVGTPLAIQDLRLHEGADTLFEKEGVPFAALKKQLFDRLQRRGLS
jgi:hypothetical protein